VLRTGALALMVGIGLLVFATLTRWHNVAENPLIITDGRGYYGYLPAAFIYGDFSYAFVHQTDPLHYAGTKPSDFFHLTPAGSVNKYFVGTAVLMAPFFAGASLWASAIGAPVDGYSPPFQMAIGMAAIFYLMVGLVFLQLLLQLLGYRWRAIAPTLLAIVFATDLLFYTVYEPSMSHVYSFCMVAAFLYFSAKAILHQQDRMWPLAAFALGLIALIRPTNGIMILALPIVAGGVFPLVQAVERLLARPRILVLSIVVFVAVVALQPLMYMLQVGQPFFWSYKGEGFNFLAPEICNVLFSYRRGLFVYAPVLLLAVAGMLAMRSRNPDRAKLLLLLISLATWIIASWWMWWYGGGFGHRAFIEYFPLFAIGLVHLFSYGWGLLRPWMAIVISAVLIAVQGIQTYQFVTNILPFDQIDRALYRGLFLRTGSDLQWYFPLHVGEHSYVGRDSVTVSNGLEFPRGWGGEEHTTDSVACTGQFASCINADNFGLTYRVAASTLPFPVNTVRVEANIRTSWTSTVSIVCTVEDSTGHAHYWAKRPLRPQFVMGGTWHSCATVFLHTVAKNPSDNLSVFLMKEDGQAVCADDFQITFIHAE
jgi:hypothetical protein